MLHELVLPAKPFAFFSLSSLHLMRNLMLADYVLCFTENVQSNLPVDQQQVLESGSVAPCKNGHIPPTIELPLSFSSQLWARQQDMV